MSNWKTAANIEPPETLSGIIYGDVGIGKTLIALSAENPALIDLEKGVHRVSRDLYSAMIPVLQPNDYPEIVEGLKDLPTSKTICIDTMGKLFDEYMLPYIKKEHPAKLKRDGELSIQGYSERKKEFKKLMRLVKSAGKNLIIIAHASTIKKEDDTIKYIPDLGIKNESYIGEIRDDLDFIGYMTMNGKRRIIAFNPTSSYDGKNSIGLMDFIQVPEIENELQNNFLLERIINPTIERRKIEKLEAQEREKITNQGLEVIKANKDPNKAFVELRKLDMPSNIAYYLFEALKKSTDMVYNEESKRFETVNGND